MSPQTAIDNQVRREADELHKKSAGLRAYQQQQSMSDQDQRIVSYLPLVHKLVSQVINYIRPPMSSEDLVSAGTVGLIKASRDFDATKDAEFKTYAYIRVRGAIIDELRQWSFTPPEVGKQLKEINKFCEMTVEKTGLAPTDEDIAREFGISVERLYKIFDGARASHFLSIHGLSEDTPALSGLLAGKEDDEPSGRIEKQELVEKLGQAIQKLPQKQKHIVILYYDQQLTMKQIAGAMNLTESRVSQLHAGAIVKLSSLLGA